QGEARYRGFSRSAAGGDRIDAGYRGHPRRVQLLREGSLRARSVLARADHGRERRLQAHSRKRGNALATADRRQEVQSWPERNQPGPTAGPPSGTSAPCSRLPPSRSIAAPTAPCCCARRSRSATTPAASASISST